MQTPQHVSLLQKVLHYLELAAQVGAAVPERHVSIISNLFLVLTEELQTGVSALKQPAQEPVTVTTPAGTHETVGIPPTS